MHCVHNKYICSLFNHSISCQCQYQSPPIIFTLHYFGQIRALIALWKCFPKIQFSVKSKLQQRVFEIQLGIAAFEQHCVSMNSFVQRCPTISCEIFAQYPEYAFQWVGRRRLVKLPFTLLLVSARLPDCRPIHSPRRILVLHYYYQRLLASLCEGRPMRIKHL